MELFRAIPITERTPSLNEWVTTIDEAKQHRVFRLTENGWNMRDLNGIHSPNDNLAITHWLEKIDLTTIMDYLAAQD